MIAKNEEKNIEKCLKSLAGINCEIVVTDTGSTDNTVSIAKRYTEHVYSYEWNNDFSAAKNYCISKAGNEIILALDCDEYIDLEQLPDFSYIEDMINGSRNKIGVITIKNLLCDEGMEKESWEYVGRIFCKNNYRYEGKVHEQLTCIGEGSNSFMEVPLAIYHTGYNLTKEQAKAKAMRNKKLLLEELDSTDESLEDKISYLYYQLGKTMFMIKDYEEAFGWFSKGLSYDVNPSAEYVKDLVESYGYTLLNLKRYQDALSLEGVYKEFSGSSDFLFLMGLTYMNNGMFEKAVSEFKNATLIKRCKVQGTNSYSANYNIGVIYECLGKTAMAKEYYTLCGDFEPAKKRLGSIG